jgi:hypothetical protein
MNKLPMSYAAAALLRALTARAGLPRDRILLTDVQSVDWQSLTFTGERHHIAVRVTGSDSGSGVERMLRGLEDAEFSIPGLVVADIAVLGEPERTLDGSIIVRIEALTVGDD